MRENHQNTTIHIIAQKLEILPELTSDVQNLLVNMHVKLEVFGCFILLYDTIWEDNFTVNWENDKFK